MPKDKVLFNLKNVHYAKQTASDDGAVTFATPVAVPGAVSLSLDAEGDVSKFYADGVVYYVCQSNNGYSGDLEVAMFPESMLTDIWGMTKSKNGLIVENANAAASNFALLFEVDGSMCCTTAPAPAPALPATPRTTAPSRTPRVPPLPCPR